MNLSCPPVAGPSVALAEEDGRWMVLCAHGMAGKKIAGSGGQLIYAGKGS